MIKQGMEVSYMGSTFQLRGYTSHVTDQSVTIVYDPFTVTAYTPFYMEGTITVPNDNNFLSAIKVINEKVSQQTIDNIKEQQLKYIKARRYAILIKGLIDYDNLIANVISKDFLDLLKVVTAICNTTYETVLINARRAFNAAIHFNHSVEVMKSCFNLSKDEISELSVYDVSLFKPGDPVAFDHRSRVICGYIKSIDENMVQVAYSPWDNKKFEGKPYCYKYIPTDCISTYRLTLQPYIDRHEFKCEVDNKIRSYDKAIFYLSIIEQIRNINKALVSLTRDVYEAIDNRAPYLTNMGAIIDCLATALNGYQLHTEETKEATCIRFYLCESEYDAIMKGYLE